MELFLIFFHTPQVHLLHLRSCPWCFAQEGKARFYTGIELEAADVQGFAHLFPAVSFYQMIEHHFQRNAVEGIIGLWVFHGLVPATIKPA